MHVSTSHIIHYLLHYRNETLEDFTNTLITSTGKTMTPATMFGTLEKDSTQTDQMLVWFTEHFRVYMKVYDKVTGLEIPITGRKCAGITQTVDSKIRINSGRYYDTIRSLPLANNFWAKGDQKYSGIEDRELYVRQFTLSEEPTYYYLVYNGAKVNEDGRETYDKVYAELTDKTQAEKFMDEYGTDLFKGHCCGVTEHADGVHITGKDILTQCVLIRGGSLSDIARVLCRGDKQDVLTKLKFESAKFRMWMDWMEMFNFEIKLFDTDTDEEISLDFGNVHGAGEDMFFPVDRMRFWTYKSDAIANNFWQDGEHQYHVGCRELYITDTGRYFFVVYDGVDRWLRVMKHIVYATPEEATSFEEEYGHRELIRGTQWRMPLYNEGDKTSQFYLNNKDKEFYYGFGRYLGDKNLAQPFDSGEETNRGQHFRKKKKQ